MMVDQLTDGIIIGISVSIPLGPIGVLIVQRTLSKGRHSGFASGIGAALSDAIYAVIASFSLSYIVDFIREQKSWIQVIGSIVLLIFGYTIFKSNPSARLKTPKVTGGSYLQDIATTFALTFSNPMAIFIFLGVFAGFNFVKGGDIEDILLLLLGIFCGALIWWFTLTFIVSLFRSKINPRGLWLINKISGIIIITLSSLSLIYAILILAGIEIPKLF